MKKKLSVFYKVYFWCLAVFACVLICFLCFLYLFVGDYNKGLAETVSRSYFEELFIGKDAKKIIGSSGFECNEFEGMQSAEGYLSALLDAKLSYTSITGKDENKKEYIVKSDEKTIAGFTLSTDEKGDFRPESLDISPCLNEIKVKTLDSSKLYLNGIQVSDKYITLREKHENAFFLEGYCKVPEYTTYTVKGFANIPEILITDRNGNSASVISDGDTLVECVLHDNNEEELCNTLLQSAQDYARCIQNEVGKQTALRHFLRGSDIYNIIRNVETGFAWDHNGSEFRDINISEFFRYDENTVSVRISFNHVLKLYGRNDYTEPFDKTIFATDTNGKYLIFAMK